MGRRRSGNGPTREADPAQGVGPTREAGPAQRTSAPAGSRAPGMVLTAALAIVCCALWGSAFAFVKLGYQLFEVAADAPAQQVLFAGMRFTLAGVYVLLGTAIARRRLPLPSRRDLVPIALVALLQTTLQYAFFYIGLANASGTNSALVQGTSAFVQIVLATLVFRQERLTGRKLVGCLLGLGGVALVTLRAGGMIGAWSMQGEGLVLMSVIAGGCAACLMRRFGVSGDPFMLTGWQFVAGGVALMGIGALLGGRIGTCSVPAVGVLAYLGALSAIAFSVWSWLLKYNPVSRVAMFRFFIPLCGVLFSVAFLGEVVPSEQLPALVGALALIAVGTVVVNVE
ncbi:MAG: DMT family transporter [Atopobiaceae bacterium]|nr:DMT family transporter [Atopobiaceae bacterium]MBR3313970.1 DMT family transporter [Atopobiaceae bacterium]